MHPSLYFALSDRLSVYCGYWKLELDETKRDALYTVTVVRDCVQRNTDQARSRAIHIHGRP